MIQRQANTVTSNRVANAVSIKVLLIAIALFTDLIPAHADGGTVQFEKSASPFVITVFTTPSPLRAGPIGLSLLIREGDNRQPVFDCQAFIQLRKEGAMIIRSEATHEDAHNKLFYAAQLEIPESGLWELEVTVKQGSESVRVVGEIDFAQTNSVLWLYWRSLAVPPMFISLFAINQWLKRRRTRGFRL